jgi:DMSO/TMAO reductase YedYZ molybdopterin-dependent catalytic subunit
VQVLLRWSGLPGGGRRFTGSYQTASTDPGRVPVTQWLNDGVPSVDVEGWTLRVEGDGQARSYSYDELAAFHDRIRADLDCTGGWYAEQEWEGVRLDRLLPGWKGARSIAVHSRTGYGRRFPAADAPSLLLAVGAGGRPLDRGHGFPARIVAPGRRGFWWVKWVDGLALSMTPWGWQPPFPLT